MGVTGGVCLRVQSVIFSSDSKGTHSTGGLQAGLRGGGGGGWLRALGVTLLFRHE